MPRDGPGLPADGEPGGGQRCRSPQEVFGGGLPEASGYASILVTYNGEARHLVQKPTGRALFNHVRECGFMSVNTLVYREPHVTGVAGGPGTGPGEQQPLHAPASPALSFPKPTLKRAPSLTCPHASRPVPFLPGQDVLLGLEPPSEIPTHWLAV